MHDARRREPALDDTPHALPGDIGLVAAPAKPAFPHPDHLTIEGLQSWRVQRHCVVVVVPTEDRSQPSSHLRDGFVPAPPKGLLPLPELGPKPLTHGLPYERETPFPRLPTHVCEAEEVERLGLAPSVPLAVLSGVATKLDQAGLFRVQFQSERRKAIAELVPK